MITSKSLLLLTFLLLLSACGRASTPAANTSAPTPLPATITHLPSMTLHPTTSPDFTLIAIGNSAQTETAISAITQTYLPKATFTEQEFLKSCRDFNPNNLSPSSQWCLVNTYDNQTGTGFSILSRSGQEWEYTYFSDVWDQTRIVSWSQDDHFLYFFPVRSIDSVGFFPKNANGLFRMDLTTGSVDSVLAVDPNFPYSPMYVLSMSPTGRRLAYIPPHTSRTDIHILDMRTGNETILSLSPVYLSAGFFTWSEDGTELTVAVIDATMTDVNSEQNCYRLTYDILTLTFLRSRLDRPCW